MAQEGSMKRLWPLCSRAHQKQREKKGEIIIDLEVNEKLQEA